MSHGRPVALAGALALVVALAGCALDRPDPTGTPTATATSQAPVPDVEPEFDPAAGAEANQPYFDFVNRRLLEQNPSADGRAFIDALTAAGFDKSRMELTRDSTPTDRVADSIQFSVRFDDGCIVGQNGADMGYLSQVRAALSTERCLIGDTRPIDW